MIRLIRWLLGLCNHDYREVSRHWLLDDEDSSKRVGLFIEFKCTKCSKSSSMRLLP